MALFANSVMMLCTALPENATNEPPHKIGWRALIDSVKYIFRYPINYKLVLPTLLEGSLEYIRNNPRARSGLS